MKNYKSDTTGGVIPVTVIEFNNGEADLWFTKQQWEEVGKYKGFLKSFALSILDIQKVHYMTVNPSRFPTAEWPC